MMNLILLILVSTIFSQNRLLVPEVYNTIQEGINAAVDGDTVLVNDGMYYENLEINKSIVLTSYAIYDDLTNWVEYDPLYLQWVVDNYHIQNTQIVGSSPINQDYGSVILIVGDGDN